MGGRKGLEGERSRRRWKGPAACRPPRAPRRGGARKPPRRPCGPVDFASGGSGECAPRGWRCDGEEDCADGGDESGCDQPCAPHLPPCARGPLCVAPAPLCDGSDGDPGACGESPAGAATRPAGGAPSPPAPTRRNSAPCASRGRSLESDLGLGAAESERVLSSLNLSPETPFENFCPPAQPGGEKKGLLSLPTFGLDALEGGQ